MLSVEEARLRGQGWLPASEEERQAFVEEGASSEEAEELAAGGGRGAGAAWGRTLVVAACLAALATAAVAFSVARGGRIQSPGQGVEFLPADMGSLERKYYDPGAAYWQAPRKPISTSELWGSCGHPHMMVCDGYCCCEAGFYWKSPKTVYQKEKGIFAEAVAGAESGSASAAETATEEAILSLGKAAAASLFAAGQKCMPKAEVPAEVVEALRDGKTIPDSDGWVTCSTFTSDSHTCGRFCCCNGGHQWSAKTETCAQKL